MYQTKKKTAIPMAKEKTVGRDTSLGGLLKLCRLQFCSERARDGFAASSKRVFLKANDYIKQHWIQQKGINKIKTATAINFLSAKKFRRPYQVSIFLLASEWIKNYFSIYVARIHRTILTDTRLFCRIKYNINYVLTNQRQFISTVQKSQPSAYRWPSK